MKKRILFCVASLILILSSCSDETPQKNKPSPFVTLEKGGFQLNGKPFYPVALNYLVTLQADENGIWASSFNGYNEDGKFSYVTKDSSLLQLKAEMDLIKELGFNTLRIVRIGEETVDDKTGAISTRAKINNKKDTVLQLSDEGNFKRYCTALDELFEIADKAGLKIIFLVSVLPDVKTTEKHLEKMADHFKNCNAIMSYDLFNEPLYFDSPERNKKDVYQITRRWHKILKTNAPNQLFTIGLEGIREVFEWDPNILDVDFVSLHPYQYEREQVRNEMYWYGKYINKPWMIGETAIPADNDSVSYLDQSKFANITLKQAHNCGAIGYSWWQYKDVDWKLFHANYMGVMNWKGQTKTKKKNITLTGTPKPVVQEFQKYNPNEPRDTCRCFENYYNYTANTVFRIIGKFVDEDNAPIQGAVILGWNQYWTYSYHTISRPDGSFELLGSFPYYHWMASFTGYTMIRGDVNPNTANTKDNIPTLDLGILKLEKLNLEALKDSVQTKN